LFIVEVAAHYGVAPAAIYHAARRAGIEMTPNGRIGRSVRQADLPALERELQRPRVARPKQRD
jgi:hypothetical protein